MGFPKPLLPWFGTTLIAYQVEQLMSAGLDSVIVVLGHESERVAAALDGYPRVMIRVNPAYQQGKSTSIRVGVESVPEGTEAILLIAVDQPRRAETLRTLISGHFSEHRPVTVPVFQGRRGHPLIVSSSLLPELLCLSEETRGLRQIVSSHHSEIAEVPCEDPEVILNLNTPEEYRQAQAYFAARGT